MTLLHSRDNPRINFAPQDLLAISEHISQAFAPSLIKPPKRRVLLPLAAEDMRAISEDISQSFAPALAPEQITLMSLPVDAESLDSNWQPDDLPPINVADVVEHLHADIAEATEANITVAVEQLVKPADVNATTLPLPRRSDDVTYTPQSADTNMISAVWRSPVTAVRHKLSSYNLDIKAYSVAPPKSPANGYRQNKTASGQGLAL